MKLNRLSMENFKGIRRFEMQPDGQVCVIEAENGVGKTSVYDAFLWLLFGKDSTSRSDFAVRPLDSDNEPVSGVVVRVDAELAMSSDRVITLRREHHEKIIKKELHGYESFCWIDDVPKKVKEYQEYIDTTISEKNFKLFTDLTYFNTKLHWTERRAGLLELAGEISPPVGFESLLAEMGDRSADDYESVLRDQKKLLTKERDEIGPRIDEIRRGMAEHAGLDKEDMLERRTDVETEIMTLDNSRKRLLDNETDRQVKLNKINTFKAKRVEREARLKSDISGTKSLLDAKTELMVKLGEAHVRQTGAKTSVVSKEIELDGIRNRLDGKLRDLAAVRNEYEAITETDVIETCYACKQKLPTDELAANADAQQKKLTEITLRGNLDKRNVDELNAEIVANAGVLTQLEAAERAASQQYASLEDDTRQQLAEIQAKIDGRPTLAPEQDGAWRDIVADIAKLEAEVGEPVATQLEDIEVRIKSARNHLLDLNDALAQYDRREDDKKRIGELEKREREISDIITNLDRVLAELAEYRATVSRHIETRVNDRFKYARFRLFKVLLNEEIQPCCDTLLDGVPYNDLSTGQQIRVGIDIVNVLSEHYQVSAPIFVDHLESLTYPLEAEAQTIGLRAVDGIKQLKVTK